MSSFTFRVDPTPSAGAQFRVYVDSAPCNPATVTAIVNGQSLGSKPCAVGSSVSYVCPAGTTGRPWKVIVECPGTTPEEASGFVG